MIRQALSHPQITTVIALARKKVEAPTGLKGGADEGKLGSVAVSDYGGYGNDGKKEFGGVEACIWYVHFFLS